MINIRHGKRSCAQYDPAKYTLVKSNLKDVGWSAPQPSIHQKIKFQKAIVCMTFIILN
jgi:hypothetical protein